jgi:hypothetical protein
MSEFNVLYRSLHRDQKVVKKAEQDNSSSEGKSSSESEGPFAPIRAWFSKTSK